MGQPGAANPADIVRFRSIFRFTPVTFLFLDAQMHLRSLRQNEGLQRAKNAVIVDGIDIVAHTIILPHRLRRSPAKATGNQDQSVFEHMTQLRV